MTRKVEAAATDREEPTLEPPDLTTTVSEDIDAAEDAEQGGHSKGRAKRTRKPTRRKETR